MEAKLSTARAILMRPEDATRGLLWTPLSSMRLTGIDPVAGELFCEEVAERIRAELGLRPSVKECCCWTEWTDNQIRASLEVAVSV
jgi:hypothetical protein